MKKYGDCIPCLQWHRSCNASVRRVRRPRRTVLHKQFFLQCYKFIAPARDVEDVVPYKKTGCSACANAGERVFRQSRACGVHVGAIHESPAIHRRGDSRIARNIEGYQGFRTRICAGAHPKCLDVLRKSAYRVALRRLCRGYRTHGAIRDSEPEFAPVRIRDARASCANLHIASRCDAYAGV